MNSLYKHLVEYLHLLSKPNSRLNVNVCKGLLFLWLSEVVKLFLRLRARLRLTNFWQAISKQCKNSLFYCKKTVGPKTYSRTVRISRMPSVSGDGHNELNRECSSHYIHLHVNPGRSALNKRNYCARWMITLWSPAFSSNHSLSFDAYDSRRKWGWQWQRKVV